MEISKLIKKRLNTTRSIGKITKALEMIATSKIQKAKKKSLDSKLFAEKVYDLVHTFTSEYDLQSIPLLRVPNKYKSGLYVLITTNKGLCGSLNTSLFRFLDNFIKKSNLSNYAFITVGKKGRIFTYRKGNLIADFSELPHTNLLASSLVKIIINHFIDGSADIVYLIYNDFVSVFTQQPRARIILPIIFKETTNLEENDPDNRVKNQLVEPKNYTFEPSYEEILSKILPFYLETQVFGVILQAEVSEYAARMMAMRNASNNAIELSQSLYLEFNKARQQAITSEVNDIVTAGIFR